MELMSISEAFELLEDILEERKRPAQQKLLQDWIYTTVNDVLDGYEPIVQLGLSSDEKLLTAFSEAGLINQNDQVVIPAGTILTRKGEAKPIRYKTTNPKTGVVTSRSVTYDIYWVSGKPKCLIAMNPQDAYELCGDNYREGD